ncbi:MAG TPA: ribonuclease III domain-containing protein [Spirochaetia bacterium]|nr:ribonuclease III domain-containing protein [Spirochaetia bacterium]
MNVNELSPLVMAYVGDAVFELGVRVRLVETGLAKVGDLHREAVARVRAPSQAACLDQLMDRLNEEEKDLVRRGRNARSSGVPQGVSVADYRHSTALETLLGCLYLKGEHARLEEIMDLIWSLEVRS